MTTPLNTQVTIQVMTTIVIMIIQARRRTPGSEKSYLTPTLTGGTLAYLVYRKLQGKPNTFAGNPLLDVASLITIFSGYPIFRAGMSSVQKQKKATDDTPDRNCSGGDYSHGRESETGLSVVWLINLKRAAAGSDYAQTFAELRMKDLQMDIAPKEAWLISEGLLEGEIFDGQRTSVDDIEKGRSIGFRIREGAVRRKDSSRKNAGPRSLHSRRGLTEREIGRGDRLCRLLISHGTIDIEVSNLVHDTVVARMIDAIKNVRREESPY